MFTGLRLRWGGCLLFCFSFCLFCMLLLRFGVIVLLAFAMSFIGYVDCWVCFELLCLRLVLSCCFRVGCLVLDFLLVCM